jgi:hypothetical protein
MGHRLLPTIVFASGSLLACGGSVAEGVDAGGTDATPQPTTDASTDAPAHDASDIRACEGGWPTTKGFLCNFDGGIACCSKTDDPDAGTFCCEARDE